MPQKTALKNIKELLKDNNSKKVFHKASGFHLTVRTMPVEGYEELDDIISFNPLRDNSIFEDPMEREMVINTIYIAYGVEEFRGNKELAKAYLDQESFGESNEQLIKEIKSVNPSTEFRIKTIILVLAFSRKELKLIHSAIDAHAKKEIAQYISEIEDPIDALNQCSELFTAFDTISNFAAQYGISIEHSALLHAKAILEERGFEIPDELAEIPQPKAPQTNVRVNGT